MAIVVISRGTFSGGEKLASAVAERLGYRCVSREVIYEAAAGYEIPAEELMAAMEKRPPVWDRLAGKRNTYLVFMRAALCEHARGGKLVYHGHVGQLLLPGIEQVLRVRVIADQEYRIRAAMAQQHFTREAAIAYIEKVDRERRQWARFLFQVEWDDALLYDLVLNLSRMSLETACEMVVHATTKPEFIPTPATAKALRDLALVSRVAAVCARDPRTRNLDLDVTADDGRVTVSGTTQSPQVIAAVPEIVRRAEGVSDVVSKVRLLREGATLQMLCLV
ncbi:MAG TPA: cytidylate kinase family protein [Candidatus Baltobacteraceae bacterium]|nr:cytidylate kinase family protein [Candidatus Baltobacteraceae bacterium]